MSSQSNEDIPDDVAPETEADDDLAGNETPHKAAPAISQRDAYRDQWEEPTKGVLWRLRHRDANNKRAVLFIHGLTGDPDATWVNDEKKLSFPELIFSDPSLTDYDVVAFKYHSGYIGGVEVGEVAKQLDYQVTHQLSQYEQIVLLAHSLGGLVSMRYILSQVALGRNIPIAGVLFYGVPTNGSHLAQVARLGSSTLRFVGAAVGGAVAGPAGSAACGFLGWLTSFGARRHKQVEQLELGGKFVQHLNDEWAFRVANGGHPSEKADRRETILVRVIYGNFDYVVPKFSAKSTYGAIDSHGLDFGHIDLVKPDGNTDDRYLRAESFLKLCRPSTDRTALKRLRQVSDNVFRAKEKLFCYDWNYNVHLHGSGDFDDPGGLLKKGFSRYVVKECRYRRALNRQVNVIGFAWGDAATENAWGRQPIYVHHLLNKEMEHTEKTQLTDVINGLLNKEPEKSWNTFFPETEVKINWNGNEFPLVAGQIETQDDAILRAFAIPNDLNIRPDEEVDFSFRFSSFGPASTNFFTLLFPWFHYKFKGRLTVHGSCSDFRASQFLLGETELKERTDYSNQSFIELKTDDIVLPDTRVEITWDTKPEKQNERTRSKEEESPEEDGQEEKGG